MRDPEPDPDDGEQEQKVDEVRVRDRLEQLVEATHVEAHDAGMGGLQGIRLTALRQRATVEILQQGVEVARFQVDDAELYGIVGRRVDTLPNRLLRPIGVAVMEGRQSPDVGGRVVLDLLGLDVWGRRRPATRSRLNRRT